MKYVKQMMIILGVTTVGEIMKYLIPLQIPGSIYGLIIMFILLMTKIIKLESVKDTGDFLVAIMPVMFIPAAVGLIDLTTELKAMLGPILVAVGPVTILVMIVSGKVTDKLMKGEKNNE